MANSLNKVTLIGHLGQPVKVHTTQSGLKSCAFSIATSESWKNKQTGEWESRTEWHNILVYNEWSVQLCEQQLEKGSKVYIEGSLQTKRYTDKNGNEKTAVQIVVPKFGGVLMCLDPKVKESKGVADYHGIAADSRKPAWQEPFINDEIPF